MNNQKIVTSMVIGLFLISSISGLVLFFDVSLGGVRATHEWLSILLFVMILAHAYTHKKVFLKYFTKTKFIPMVTGVILGLIVFLFSFKDKYAAEEIFNLTVNLSLSTVSEIFSLTPEEAKQSLEIKGFSVSLEQTLVDISNENNKDIYDVIDILLESNEND